MTEPGPVLDAREILAAEFALGLLDGEQRDSALRQQNLDPAFAILVAKWEGLTADWLDELPKQAAAPAVWRRIETALNAGASSAAPPVERGQSWVPRSAVRRWQVTALAASVAALAFAGLWGFAPRQVSIHAPDPNANADRAGVSVTAAGAATGGPQIGDLSVGQIQGDEKQLVTAAYDLRSGKLLLRLAAMEAARRIPELWVIGRDGKPRSLGFLQPGKAMTLTIAPQMRDAFEHGATIAVSLERPSNRPHEAPGGPILGKTTLSSI